MLKLENSNQAIHTSFFKVLLPSFEAEGGFLKDFGFASWMVETVIKIFEVSKRYIIATSFWIANIEIDQLGATSNALQVK